MKKKKPKLERDPYISGGTILMIVCLIITAFSLHSYIYGTEEEFLQSGQGNFLAPSQAPKNYGSIMGLITSAGIGLVGIILWIVGLINKIRTSQLS